MLVLAAVPVVSSGRFPWGSKGPQRLEVKEFRAERACHKAGEGGMTEHPA